MRRAAAKRASTVARTAFFVVVGRPVTQGSLSSFKSATTGRIITPQSQPLVAWRNKVAAVGGLQRCYLARPVPVSIELEFWLEVGQRADIDKLVRAVFDALTGVLFEDDVQVINLWARKREAVEREPHVTVRMQEAGT